MPSKPRPHRLALVLYAGLLLYTVHPLALGSAATPQKTGCDQGTAGRNCTAEEDRQAETGQRKASKTAKDSKKRGAANSKKAADQGTSAGTKSAKKDNSRERKSGSDTNGASKPN